MAQLTAIEIHNNDSQLIHKVLNNFTLNLGKFGTVTAELQDSGFIYFPAVTGEYSPRLCRGSNGVEKHLMLPIIGFLFDLREQVKRGYDLQEEINYMCGMEQVLCPNHKQVDEAEEYDRIEVDRL